MKNSWIKNTKAIVLIAILMITALNANADSYREPIVEEDAVIVNIDQGWRFKPEGANYHYVDLPYWYNWKEELTPENILALETENWTYTNGIRQVDYIKFLDIPSSMQGKRIFIRFEAVNYLCQVYINNQLVGGHDGGYVPFEVDITSHVDVPSDDNVLKVHIENSEDRFLNAASTNNERIAHWPIGVLGAYNFLGIIESVHLIGRASVFVDDVFIKTSYRQSEITAEITIKNCTNTAKTVQLNTQVMDGYDVVFSGESQEITIGAMSTATATVSKSWADPVLWQMLDPYFYYWRCELRENGLYKSSRLDRFGFREFWIEDKIFKLNGYRCNLRGDKIVVDSERHLYPYYYPDPDSWDVILDSLVAYNINSITFHQEPTRSWMIDACDERGLLVNEESAVIFVYGSGTDAYYENSKVWMREWIRRDRNHPSIVLWTSSSEAWLFGLMKTAYIKDLGNQIALMDNTKPYLFAGDYAFGDYADIISTFYLWTTSGDYRKPNWPGCNLYDIYKYMEIKMGGWRGSPDYNAPLSIGEFDCYPPVIDNEQDHADRIRSQSLKTRAARIYGAADIKPYRLDWMWHPNPDYFTYKFDGWSPTREDVVLMKNSMSPLATVDKEYYACELFPDLEYYDEDQVCSRTMIFFNDDISGTTVDIEWRLLINNLEIKKGEFTLDIPLGESLEQTVDMLVPGVNADDLFEIEWIARKGGKERHRERYLFGVNNTGNTVIQHPGKVQNCQINYSDNSATITWNPVTRDIAGTQTVIDHYVVYQSSSYQFDTDVDSVEVINPQYTESVPMNGDIAIETMFYKVRAVDYADRCSEFSSTTGIYTCHLSKTQTTSFNHLSIPVELEDIHAASDLHSIIPESDAITIWEESTQAFIQYAPEIPPTDFSVETGESFFAHIKSDADLHFTGVPLDLQFSLIYHPQNTSWNDIVLPFDQTGLENASDLYADIPNCDGVAQWIVTDGENDQYYHQYVSGVSSTDFQLIPGMPYQVHVTQNGGWPENHISKPIESLSIIADASRKRIPHAVWGRLAGVGDENAAVHFQASYYHDPENMLTETSPGCQFKDNIWMIQCASLPSGWKAGDTLMVKLFTDDMKYGQTLEIPLTWKPADFSGITRMDVPLSGVDSFILYPNYPNPFNSTTQISYYLKSSTEVNLSIYNVRGQLIKTLVQGMQDAGIHTISWHGKNMKGHDIGSGLYIIRLNANHTTLNERILLIR